MHFWDLQMILTFTMLILFKRTFEMILYMLPTRLIGWKHLTSIAPTFLGIRAMKLTFKLFLNFPKVYSYRKICMTSSFTTSQVWKNTMVKPYGPVAVFIHFLDLLFKRSLKPNPNCLINDINSRPSKLGLQWKGSKRSSSKCPAMWSMIFNWFDKAKPSMVKVSMVLFLLLCELATPVKKFVHLAPSLTTMSSIFASKNSPPLESSFIILRWLDFCECSHHLHPPNLVILVIRTS